MDLFTQFGIPEPTPFSGALKVLVAESHNEIRLILSHHLTKLGFVVHRTERSGKVALAELLNDPAHITVAGDDLPGVAGLELLRELRENPKAQRGAFVLLTKALQKNEAMLAIEAGVDDFMVRPIALTDLMPKIRTAYANFVNPKSPERVYEFAKSKLRTDDLNGAKAVYEALSLSNPKAARPYVGLARVALLSNQVDVALKQVNFAVERNAMYVHAHALKAEILVKMNKVAEATEAFSTAIKISPLNITRYEQCCDFLLKNKLINETISILEIGLTAGLHDPFIAERIGYCYFENKDYPKAQKYLRQAARTDPENMGFANSLAICCRDAGLLDESVEIYNTILKRENDNHLVLFNKALVLILQNKKDEAGKILKRCLKIAPEFEKAKAKLGEIGIS